MTEHINPRRGWVRQRIRELQQSGMRYSDARKQADAEADEKFADGDNGNGATG